jgi:type VI secretion system secreted protein VgrG
LPTYTQDNRLIRINTPLGKDELLLQSFSGEEGISKLFHFDLQMHGENRSIKFDDIVGKPATISVVLEDRETERHINGYINYFSQGGTSSRFAHYHATLVPWLWMLTRRSDCRIFQQKSVPEIIQEVFKSSYQNTEFRLGLHGNYAPRDYCVQYRETDFNFISRLMEEEGIFYFFEHNDAKHTLVLADNMNEIKPCPFQSSVRYESISQGGWTEDTITEWQMEQEIRPGAYELRDFNFTQPTVSLSATVEGKDERKLQIYDYPGEYATKDEGERLVKIRMDEENSPRVVASGASLCRVFVPGYKFTLKQHYRPDTNTDYVLTHVHHSADQGDDYETTGSAADENYQYENHFRCLPAPDKWTYRPARTTPVPRMHGSQTARVVGPAGEEIYVDEYGRVKVQFHWDREGRNDQNSSCWVRVSQNWAGAKWGAIFLPRIGQEVIVDFLEGDPDQPIITGRVYNGANMPPYKLPDEMTKSTIKSDSTKGGGGFNELRFEDKKGEEQIFVHGEKQLDIRIKKDRLEWIGQDRHLQVVRHNYKKVQENEHNIIEQDQFERIKRDHHIDIGGKKAINIGGSRSEKVGGAYGLKASSIAIEADSEITLKAGGSTVHIGPGGVTIQGAMVKINCGPAGSSPSLVAPTKPEEAQEADKADPGEKAKSYNQDELKRSQLELARLDAPAHKPDSEENKEKTAYIAVKLVDEAGEPVPGELCRITFPDGSYTECALDEKGFLRVDHIDPGTCKITFPNLDQNAWEPK